MQSVQVVLTLGSLFGVLGVCRLLLSISTAAWNSRRVEQIDALVARRMSDFTLECDEFHSIMSQPKPWYVRLNDVLERRHV